MDKKDSVLYECHVKIGEPRRNSNNTREHEQKPTMQGNIPLAAKDGYIAQDTSKCSILVGLRKYVNQLN